MTVYHERPARWEWLALAAILLLAAVLRLGAPGVSEFKLDEAHLSQLALDMARGRDFPLLGISSSVGIPNMPVSVWLFALPYLFSSDPAIATLFVGLLNVIAVGLTWWLTRRYFGPGAALAAALLYAASPWGVIYSRKIWAQNLLPSFVILTVGTGLIGLVEAKQPHRWRWLIGHGLLLAITVQIHYAALVLVPITAWMLWLGRRNLSRRLWIGIGVVTLAGIAGVAGLIMVATDRGVDWSGLGRNGLGLTTDALYHFMITVSGNEIHALAGAGAFQDYLASVPDIVLVQTLFGWLIIISALVMLIAAWRSSGLDRHVRLVLVAWLILPVAVFSITWTPTFPHYLIPLMPAAFIIFGVGITALWQMIQRRFPARARPAAILLASLLLVFTALQAWNVTALYAFLNASPTPNAFGTPLHYLLAVRDAILADQPDDVLIVGRSDDTRIDQEAAIWTFLLDEVPSVRPFDAGHMSVVSLARDLTAIITPSAPPGDLAVPPWLTSCEADGQQFELRPGEGQYTICTVTPIDAVPSAEDTLATFNNGAHLVGTMLPPRSVDPPGINVRLFWTANGPLAGNYSAFNHLLDADGNRIGQRDGPLWSGQYWRADELVTHFFELPADVDLDAVAILRVGLYQFIDGQPGNLDILDETGNPAGQWVDIPAADIMTSPIDIYSLP